MKSQMIDFARGGKWVSRGASGLRAAAKPVRASKPARAIWPKPAPARRSISRRVMCLRFISIHVDEFVQAQQRLTEIRQGPGARVGRAGVVILPLAALEEGGGGRGF